MDGLTSISVNKNRKEFSPKVNKKHTPRKAKINHESTSNINEPSKEGKPKMSTSFVKSVITPSSTISKTNMSKDITENNNSDSNNNKNNSSCSDNVDTTKGKLSREESISISKDISNKNKGKSKSIPVIFSAPNNNIIIIPTNEMINNNIVSISEITNDKNTINTTNNNHINDHNHDHNHNFDKVLTSETVESSQNSNYHTSVFNHTKALSLLLHPSSSKNNPTIEKDIYSNSNNSNLKDHSDNKASDNRNREYNSVKHSDGNENDSDNDIPAPFLRRRLSQIIMDITHDEPPIKDFQSSNNHRQNIKNSSNKINKSDINNSDENVDKNSSDEEEDKDGENSNDEEDISQPDENVLQECSNAPQVRIVDGKIVLDQSSLYIVNQPPKKGKRKYEYVEEDERSNTVNSQSYKIRPKIKGKKWSKVEMDSFYLGLKRHGTDFEMIAKTIPTRTRVEVKNFFNRQEKINPLKITDAVLCRNSSN